MEVKTAIMLRVLLNRYHKNAHDPILRGLPQEDIQLVLNQAVSSDDIEAAILPIEDKLHRIHYSWLINPLQQLPTSLQPYVLASLLPAQATNIVKLLHIAYPYPDLSPPLKRFFLTNLYHHLNLQEILPASFLPESPLKILATYSKQQLMDMFDLLGMHDLVQEVRQIVDKVRLKNLYGHLTKKQQLYLKMIMHQQDKIASTKLGLDQLKETTDKLDAEIHRRGMIRFAKALSGQHPDLFWYVTHTLDTGRSAILTKFYSEKEIPAVSSVLAVQIVNLMNFLKPSPREST